MKQKLGVFIGAVVAILLIVIGVFVANSQEKTTPGNIEFYSKEEISTLAESINFSQYLVNGINPTDDNAGGLAEKIKGNPDQAVVTIYEFADYACSHCAETNTELNRIYNDYAGKVAIVFRSYMLGFENGVAAASAANAAFIQGYWEQYKNILFTEQASWVRLQGSKLEDYFVRIFKEASNGAGNVKQFIEDMGSTEVVKRIAFDQAAGDSIGVSSTPYLMIDGHRVAIGEIRTIIDNALSK